MPDSYTLRAGDVTDYEAARVHEAAYNDLFGLGYGEVAESWEPDQTYRIFVFAENRKVNLAEFEGNDGNGYYGTGFWVEIVDGGHDE